MSETFFTADQHFGSWPIAKLRHFPHPNAMDAALIKAWNEVVRRRDVVWVLGDFGYSDDKRKLASILEKLHGRKLLVMGNHDELKMSEYVKAGFSEVYKEETSCGAWRLIHQPTKFKRKTLCGHYHREKDGIWSHKGEAINVGADFHNLNPVTLRQLKEKLGAQSKAVEWLTDWSDHVIRKHKGDD